MSNPPPYSVPASPVSSPYLSSNYGKSPAPSFSSGSSSPLPAQNQPPPVQTQPGPYGPPPGQNQFGPYGPPPQQVGPYAQPAPYPIPPPGTYGVPPAQYGFPPPMPYGVAPMPGSYVSAYPQSMGGIRCPGCGFVGPTVSQVKVNFCILISAIILLFIGLLIKPLILLSIIFFCFTRMKTFNCSRCSYEYASQNLFCCCDN